MSLGLNGLIKRSFTRLLTDIFVRRGPALILKGLSHLVCVFFMNERIQPADGGLIPGKRRLAL